MITSAVLKVLIVVTSHSQLGTTGKTTGYYLSEVTHPVAVLEKSGLSVDIASPQGGKAPMDESSLDLKDPVNKSYMGNSEFVKKLNNTLKLSKVDSSKYSAILFAGGHGTMWDFKDDSAIGNVAKSIYEKGGVVAAVCHGPAALINIKLSNNDYLIKGKNVAGFSNDEEKTVGLTKVVPFSLEDELVNRGAKYSKTGLWGKHVVVDGRLVTGQNPASAEGVGEEVAKILKK